MPKKYENNDKDNEKKQKFCPIFTKRERKSPPSQRIPMVRIETKTLGKRLKNFKSQVKSTSQN